MNTASAAVGHRIRRPVHVINRSRSTCPPLLPVGSLPPTCQNCLIATKRLADESRGGIAVHRSANGSDFLRLPPSVLGDMDLDIWGDVVLPWIAQIHQGQVTA